MRRPGSRPYECVRRAWHSDRHQPIRGSLIQEIFRVVNEVHSSTTKKNKEWQEKLPIVVLKAEEILYSKADSEADYMDITTLWVRINEAINTIIRLDESTETGEFLHPCIEAALYLGCIPRRLSRSNRNSNLRCYLTSCTRQVVNTPPCMPDNTIRLADWSSKYVSYCPKFSKQTSNLTDARLKFRNHAGAPIRVGTNQKSSIVRENVWPSISNLQYLTDTVSGWNMFSLCPLYHRSNPACEECRPGIEILPKPLSSNLGFVNSAMVKNFHSCDAIAAKNITEASTENTLQEQCRMPCDLSLRLGPHPLSVPHTSIDNSRSETIKAIGASTSQNQIVSSINGSLQLDKKFSFVPWGYAYDPLESRSREQSFRVDI